MIQGYTLAMFPKVTQYILCTTREETGKRTLHTAPSGTSGGSGGCSLYPPPSPTPTKGREEGEEGEGEGEGLGGKLNH